ncbi:hypothetical protein IV203_015555 [Nitzschia inconspicua]|uniref:Uncharacterized protein n=1 Tax=Nitzschia inconspicua TaxID=303405 RepID=A0A9K3LDX6_9STRA|nr:hypothetical protein IV203_015555 [Nitzschia inconspicua]
MSWTTGAKRFEKVKQVLEGKHKDVLLSYMNAEASRSVDSFQDAMDTILAEFFEETVDYEDQMVYLRTGLKKPSTMSPKEFATLFEMAGYGCLQWNGVAFSTIQLQDAALQQLRDQEGYGIEEFYGFQFVCNFTPIGYVNLKDVSFPEFSHTRRLPNVKCYVFDAPCRYDLIIGRDALRDCGMMIDFGNEQLSWFDNIVAFRTLSQFMDNSTVRTALEVSPYQVQIAEGNSNESFYTVTGPLKASDYRKVEIETVVAKQTHLDKAQQTDLLKVLK